MKVENSSTPSGIFLRQPKGSLGVVIAEVEANVATDVLDFEVDRVVETR